MTPSVDRRERPAAAVDKAMTSAPGETPFAAILARLAAKARLALRLAGEGNGPIFARASVAGEAANLPAILGRLLSAGEEPVAADEDRVLRRISSLIAGGDTTPIPGPEGGFFAAMARQEAHIIVHATTGSGEYGKAATGRVLNNTPGAGEDGKAATVRVLNNTLGAGEEGGAGLHLVMGLLKQTPVAGEAAILGRLLSADEEPVAAEERPVIRRISTIVAGHQGRFGPLARLPGLLGMPMHSGASRIVALGAVATRRFHSSSTAAELGQDVVAQLSKRVAGVESSTEMLFLEFTAVEKRTILVEQKLKKIRRGLVLVQTALVGAVTAVALSAGTIYLYWDPIAARVKAYLFEQGKSAITVYGSEVRNNAKRYVKETFSLSNASSWVSTITFGYFGSSLEEQAEKAVKDLLEEKMKEEAKRADGGKPNE